MSAKYLKIKPSDDFFRKYGIKNFEIEYINLFSKKREMEIFVKVHDFAAHGEIQDLRQMIYRNFEDGVKLKIKLDVNPELIRKNVAGFVKFMIENYRDESKRYQYIFATYEVENVENNVFVKLPSRHLIEEAQKTNVKEELKNKICECTDDLIKVEFTDGEFKEIKEKLKAQSELKSVKASELPKYENTGAKNGNGYSNGGNFNGNNNGYRRKKIPDMDAVPFSTLDILNIGDNVALEGKVFNLDMRETKNGKLMCDFMITDYTNSVSCRIFFNTSEDIQVKLGEWVKVTGSFESDMYTGEMYVRTQKAEAIDSKDVKREDNAPKKRIELHAHTNMSEMSGVMSIKDYAKRAKEFGHSGIAVTDYGVVHSFPFAFKEANEDFKVILGIEAYMVDDEQDLITNPKDKMIEDEIYVVFDIETTGFDPFNDKIIEIGAVKMRGKEIIGEFSEFVNPEIPIPPKITKLTTITDEMVANAEKIETVLPKFLEFCDNTTVVAHNAKFDLGFIDKSFERLGLENKNNASIDTLFISRAENKEAKRHGLSNLAKMYKVRLVQHHRAIYDTKATAEIFIKMLNQLYALGIEHHNEIDNKIDLKFAHTRSRTFPCSILVKNAKGLKDLFRLVSYSCTEYLSSGKPTIPRSLLEQYRQDLLIGSGNSENEVFEELLNSKEDKVESIIDFYDYIEIQPMNHYESFITNERIADKTELKIILKKLISLSKKKGKIVVATGDCYYLDEYQHVYRQILRLSVKNNPGARDIKPMATFLTTEEMLEEFSFLDKELREEIVIENTHKISDKIELVVPLKDKLYTPNIEGAADEVRNLSYSMAHKIYGEELPEIVEKRLEKELTSIIGNGFSVVYLISHKLVKKSLDDGYLVGSRGSVGSSLVATMMEITEVNPLAPHYVCPKCKHSEFFLNAEYASGFDLPNKNCPHCDVKMTKDGQDIPFETFLGFNGDKVPDIDLNFSGEYQATAHNFTKEIFGEDYVYRAGTIATVAEKTAYSFTRDYYEKNEIEKRNIDLERIAAGCEGAKRTTGQHPGGILVVPNDMDIFDFTPYQYPADDETSSWRTTHFDFHSIHDNILKFDILGHDDPTMIRKLQDLSGINPKTIDVSDPEVMGIFSGVEALGVTREQVNSASGTFGIPEFGTNFVIQMLDDTKPTTYSELVQISGLSHGTDVWLGNAQELIRNGTCELKDVIGCRDDIMVYLIHAGLEEGLAFTIMESVRKGKGLTEDFEAAMKENDVPAWYIDSCKKIKYMFPKAHACAYVLMALRIAWFKVHQPLTYYCAYYSVRASDFDIITVVKGEKSLKAKIEEIKTTDKNELTAKDKDALVSYEIANEMMERGFTFSKVDLEKSASHDYIMEGNTLIPPFSIVPGLGDNVAKKIVQARLEKPFLSIEDFSKRGSVSSTVVEYLREMGTLKGLPERAQLSFFDEL